MITIHVRDADALTKGSFFLQDRWTHLTPLFGFMSPQTHVSSHFTVCSSFRDSVSKRPGEGHERSRSHFVDSVHKKRKDGSETKKEVGVTKRTPVTQPGETPCDRFSHQTQ